MWFRAEALPIHDDVHDAFMALLSHSSTRVENSLLEDLWGSQEGSVVLVTLGFLCSHAYDMSKVSGNIEVSEYIGDL